MNIKEAKTQSTNYTNFPVIAIGASAGGLAAFESFFSGMTEDKHPNMAFVLIQHLAPDHKSMLVEFIKQYSSMQVYEAEENMTIEPNCIYVIPPNKNMAFENGKLRLFNITAPRGQNMPIDFFFRSLAINHHDKAVCIILSGTGSDGTLGLRAIKAEGGIAIVQSIDSAEYDGMPNSAIETGLVDYQLAPNEIIKHLTSFFTYSNIISDQPMMANSSDAENDLKAILNLIRNQTSHDFSKYKPNMIVRRIERRLAVNRVDSLKKYIKILQKKPEEIDILMNDLLIGVTHFFRDHDAFLKLEQTVIPMLFNKQNTNGAIRVWCAGCSSGEEAYSVAILIHEYMEKFNKKNVVQIFATDINQIAINTARNGVYSSSILIDMTLDRVNRHFTFEPESKSYRIIPAIREMLIFSVQSIVKDPPFSKLDLICCRNLLIYLSSDLQKKIIPLFHYSLNPEGVLFLGISETVGIFEKLFDVIDRKQKIYSRKASTIEFENISLNQIIEPYVKLEPYKSQLHRKNKAKSILPLHNNVFEDNKTHSNHSTDMMMKSLKASNEELQSVNEEVQSTNEELETSKEELQSINEELTTVNSELQIKVHELTLANNDMNNLLSGTNIATVFLDCDQNIMRFTPLASKIINFIQSDIGRPLAHFSTNLMGYYQLNSDVKKVLDTLITQKFEVQSQEGSWYEMIIQPYRTIDNVVEGAVLTFVDITQAKIATERLALSELSYRTLFETTQEGILIIDGVTGKIKKMNPYIINLLGYGQNELFEKHAWEIGLFNDVMSNKKAFMAMQKLKYSRFNHLNVETSDGREIEVEIICNAYELDQTKIVQCNIRLLS